MSKQAHRFRQEFPANTGDPSIDFGTAPSMTTMRTDRLIEMRTRIVDLERQLAQKDAALKVVERRLAEARLFVEAASKKKEGND